MTASESGAGARKKLQPYRCFLVRCRLEEEAGSGGESGWRFTVQEAGPDAARRAFACLKDVEAYLEAQLGWPGSNHVNHERRTSP